ncbi:MULTISPECIES: hypothetical protein [Paenibacillus]|uniref:hypothetical protein n=1 Tax=Paenibacillus TaxID=44249 RepID=UPI000B85FAD5|nr:hypothetical protein [Paenibacillus amylolyticus]
MKRAGISFLMIFVLMFTLGTQVFAQNDHVFMIADNDTRPAVGSVTGQHAYGFLEARILENERNTVTVTLFEVLPNGSFRPLHQLTASPNNRHVSTHYYLEGGKQYTINVQSRGYGMGQLANYIP